MQEENQVMEEEIKEKVDGKRVSSPKFVRQVTYVNDI
jgi:hypothetical protein